MNRPALLALVLVAAPAAAQEPGDWKQHALDRPAPRIVTPAPAGPPLAPPSDAVILFDGGGLGAWQRGDGQGPAGWTLRDGYMEAAPGAGDIRTIAAFGDVQLHLEWMAPAPPRGEGQDRGNSGVFFMERYELQVLDSWRSATYPDGQAAAIYGQFPPLVNAARAPGAWQSYDVIFHRPRFTPDGKLAVPARMTVLHNGVLVHEEAMLFGPTSHQRRDPYTAHPDRLPIKLQDHGSPVRYRNIWVRDLTPP